MNDKKTAAPYSVPIGVTWVDGRAIFRREKKWSGSWYGICHFSEGVVAITPIDFDGPKMITTIMVSPLDKYCERAFSCLNFTCPLNQFDKEIFMEEFKGMGAFSLGLPRDFGTKPLWFSEGKFIQFWKKFIIHGEGGRIEVDEFELGKISG